MKKTLLGMAAALTMGGLLASTAMVAPALAAGPKVSDIVTHYADLGYAMYGDAVTGAQALDKSIDAFLADPNDKTLAAARDAWRAARVPYMQTESFRFGNPEVDDLEGNVNSWPLDEGLIDYVADSYGQTSDSNPYYRLNIIANKELQIGKDKIDASVIDKKLIQSMEEVGNVETNVAIGYHAVEFLLWGQDLNGTGPGAGNRPASDYDQKNCTHGNCDRRAAYLKASTDLLVDDLTAMRDLFAADGAVRKRLTAAKPEDALVSMFTGLGSLSYGELAGERTKLGLMLHDPEQEHDCFSDNTHNSDFYDQQGMVEVYNGTYTKLDGTKMKGASLHDFVKAHSADADKRIEAAMKKTTGTATVMKQTADSGKWAYDQMIGADNPEGNKIVQNFVDALVAQAHAIEAGVTASHLAIKVEGSDSLDNPSAVKTN
ncbi:MAG TPA: imelysin family protein [Terriglobales bacterium]|nr:imelysin family protein [Terriglobales bacterium]